MEQPTFTMEDHLSERLDSEESKEGHAHRPRRVSGRAGFKCDYDQLSSNIKIQQARLPIVQLHEGALKPVSTILEQEDEPKPSSTPFKPKLLLQVQHVVEVTHSLASSAQATPEAKPAASQISQPLIIRKQIGLQQQGLKHKNKSFLISKRQNFAQVNQQSLEPRRSLRLQASIASQATQVNASQGNQRELASQESEGRLDWINDQKQRSADLGPNLEQPQKPRILIRKRMKSSQKTPLSVIQQTEHLDQFVQPSLKVLQLTSLHKFLLGVELALRDRTAKEVRTLCAQIAALKLDGTEELFDIFKRKAIQSWLFFVRSSLLLFSYSSTDRQRLEALSKVLRSLATFAAKNSKQLIVILSGDQFQEGFYDQRRRSTSRPSWDQFLNNNSVLEELSHKGWEAVPSITELFRKLVRMKASQTQKSKNLALAFSSVVFEEGLQSKLPFLARASSPFLPFREGYTLLVNPLRVLVAVDGRGKDSYLWYSGADQFLQSLSNYYEVILFADMAQDKLSRLAQKLFPAGCELLWRSHFSLLNGRRVLEGREVGRQFRRTLVIDSEEETCKANAPNSIMVRHSSKRGLDDQVLWKLIPVLQELVQRKLLAKEGIQFVRSALAR